MKSSVEGCSPITILRHTETIEDRQKQSTHFSQMYIGVIDCVYRQQHLNVINQAEHTPYCYAYDGSCFVHSV